MRIEHLALWAKDIDVVREFYEKYFGARSNKKYVNDSKQFASYFLHFESGARLEIMQRPDVVDSKAEHSSHEFLGYAHIAMSVGSESDVDDLTERIVADGFVHIDGPRRTGDGFYESVVLDPEGNRIEITA